MLMNSPNKKRHIILCQSITPNQKQLKIINWKIYQLTEQNFYPYVPQRNENQ